MKIPSEAADRLAFYLETVQKCFASQQERRDYYDTLRLYVRRGGLDETVELNNMGAHLDLLCSMVYAQDTTRFSMEADATADASIFDKLPISARRVQQEWHDSNCDILFGDGILAAFTCGSSIIKLLWDGNGVNPYVVDADKFGVLRENIGMLDRQQACAHHYSITKAALWTQLDCHPKGEDIKARITAAEKPGEEQRTDSQKLFITASEPNMVGSSPASSYITGSHRPQAKVTDPVVEMTELYVYDDDEKDFKVVTIAEPGVIIYERMLADIYIKNELPFVQICPNPDMRYFWGESEADKLRYLQDWLNIRLRQIRNMLNRQAEPPAVGSGLFGDEAEIAEGMQTPNTYIPGDEQGNWKLQELKPDIPEDLFREVTHIMEMFNQVSGLSNILQGRGEAGVRSDQHANTLGKFASTRIKKRAGIIEDSLEKAATLIWRLLRKFSADKLVDAKGQTFLLQQLTANVMVKVDAHSNSPAFVEDMKEFAFAMYRDGLIDGEGFFDLTNPPMKEILKSKSREMSAQRAEQQQQNEQFEKVVQLRKAAK